MLEIWGRPFSSNVIPVLWAVNEAKCDYQLQLAGGSFGKLQSDAYAQINPNKMIPNTNNFNLFGNIPVLFINFTI